MNNEHYDLHCHSTASDGALTPTALVERANSLGVTSLALTDHDTTAGLAEARKATRAIGITLIPGIELSASWNEQCVHIVGLGIDPENPALKNGCVKIHDVRIERAERMSHKLEKKRIYGAFDAVVNAAGEGMITRTHFADFLVSHQHVSTQQEAFDRFLGRGKPAYVATEWTELEQAVAWITGAGGVAVLAHPLRYQFTATRLRKLLTNFKDVGGQGIEVVCGRNDPEDIRISAGYARQFALAGSVGSDFHNPEYEWIELGRLSPLPESVTPVWQLFPETDAISVSLQ
ncbi:MAG: PHP domain-containing protein [Gammaproteobacteria bacterium]